MIKKYLLKIFPDFQSQLYQQFFRFILTGLMSTLISFFTFYFLLNFLAFHYLAANAVSFLTGISFSYPINKKWSFGYKAEKFFEKSRLAKYVFIYLSSLLMSMVILQIAVGYFNIKAELAYILTIFFTTITNFCGIKFLVFSK